MFYYDLNRILKIIKNRKIQSVYNNIGKIFEKSKSYRVEI